MNNMSKKFEDYILYPAITAIVCTGVTAFSDWRRDTLESIWWYVIAVLILYAVMALGRYIIWGRKK